MKTRFIFIYIILLALSLFSCNDFLELEPQSELTSANFYKTANDFNAALKGAYDNLQRLDNDYFELVEYRSDNLFLSAPTAGTQDRYNLDQFAETTANGLVEETWRDMYIGIARSNEIISRVTGATFTEDLKLQYEGEARFLRAFYYFNLARFWGDVPLSLTPLSPEASLGVGRTSINEVYATIESDLIIAKDQLPQEYASKDRGRATSGAAKTLLAKVYLTQKKYNKAKDIAREVIDSQVYTLLDDVAEVFDPTNQLNDEVIFAIRYNKEDSDEDHGLWFATSDPSTTSPIANSLLEAYELNDARRNLLEYTQQGTGYVLNKYADIPSEITNNAGNDFIVLRYADVLLMYAEALNEIGFQNSGDAFDYLNRVRNRADLSSLSALELPDQGTFRKAILEERRLEFPLEGQRWFDLIRTGMAEQEVLANQGISMQSHQYLYPIPESEIQKMNNPSIFSQNPGY